MKKKTPEFFYGIDIEDNSINKFVSSEFIFSKKEFLENIIKASTTSGLEIPYSFTMHAEFLPNSLKLIFSHKQKPIWICQCFKQTCTKDEMVFVNECLPLELQYPCFAYRQMETLSKTKYNFLYNLLKMFTLAYFSCEKELI